MVRSLKQLNAFSAKVKKASSINYEVESIIGKRVEDGIPIYLIKWLGYDISEATWMQKKQLNNCKKLLNKYEREIKKRQH